MKAFWRGFLSVSPILLLTVAFIIQEREMQTLQKGRDRAFEIADTALSLAGKLRDIATARNRAAGQWESAAVTWERIAKGCGCILPIDSVYVRKDTLPPLGSQIQIFPGLPRPFYMGFEKRSEKTPITEK